MIVVLVHVHIKAEAIEAFKLAIEANARASVKEPGVARFDVIQQKDDPQRFVLIEAYRHQDDIARHKQTAHYLTWREKAEPMMAEPRYGIAHENVWPEDQAW